MFPDNDSVAPTGADNDGVSRVPTQKLSSQDLFRNSSTVCIEHHGEYYWLRLTRGNKLILTK